MGLLDSFFKAVYDSKGTAKISLKEAAESAPELMGCYKVFAGGELKYVGRSGYSLRQRFAQYYDGKMITSAAAKRIHDLRDDIQVSWIVLSSERDCSQMERQWILRLDPEWNRK